MRTAIGALLLALAGCALLGPPSWVTSYPSDDDYIYGVGSAGITYDENPAKSREIAKQRALDDLAKQIRVRVTSATVVHDRQQWTHYEAETLQFSDEDLEGIEILDVWVDDWGWAGKAEQTYVLVRMSKAKALGIAARQG